MALLFRLFIVIFVLRGVSNALVAIAILAHHAASFIKNGFLHVQNKGGQPRRSNEKVATEFHRLQEYDDEKWSSSDEQGKVNEGGKNLLQRKDFFKVMPLVGFQVLPLQENCLAIAIEENRDTSQKCKDGAIVAEDAIPGAYEQICMSLPERSITLQATGDVLTIQQNVSSSVAGRTGVVIWNSSLVLLRVLDELALATTAENGNFFTGKTMLELGCGTAICSIAAAKLAKQGGSLQVDSQNMPVREETIVFATDGNDEVITLAKQNAERNQVLKNGSNKWPSVQVSQLSWGLLDAMEYSENIDFVFGSDLTYNSNSWPALAKTVATLLVPQQGIFCYLTCGHAGFNMNSEIAGFTAVAQSEGLKVLSETDKLWPFRNPVTSEAISLKYLLQRRFERERKDNSNLEKEIQQVQILIFALV